MILSIGIIKINSIFPSDTHQCCRPWPGRKLPMGPGEKIPVKNPVSTPSDGSSHVKDSCLLRYRSNRSITSLLILLFGLLLELCRRCLAERMCRLSTCLFLLLINNDCKVFAAATRSLGHNLTFMPT